LSNTDRRPGIKSGARKMKFIQTIKNASEFIRIIFEWMLTELAFNLLPILVIMTMNLITTGKLDFLYLSPEWSFLTIVLLGSSVTKLLKLKINVQRDFSDNVVHLMRITVLALISATIILSLVSTQKLFPSLNKEFLSSSQTSLLAFSIFIGFVADVTAIKHKKEEVLLPIKIGKSRYYEAVSKSIDTICDEANYLKYAFAKQSKIGDDSGEYNELSALEASDSKDRVSAQLLLAKKKIDALYEAFNSDDTHFVNE
jgi:hypothetical protein